MTAQINGITVVGTVEEIIFLINSYGAKMTTTTKTDILAPYKELEEEMRAKQPKVPKHQFIKDTMPGEPGL